MDKAYKKYPRIYIESPLKEGGSVCLSKEHSHYLVNVMRKSVGDGVRLFNGLDGEFFGEITEASKKSVSLHLIKCLFAQPIVSRQVHLYFAPIKKQRMEWMIEKAVELGATHLHPIVTQNTEVRKLNMDRVRHQIIEACEQCERMDVPVLHDIMDLKKLLVGAQSKILVALERQDDLTHVDEVLSQVDSVSFLIGPEGGFTQDEADLMLSSKRFQAVSLGDRILRAETAALYVLSLV